MRDTNATVALPLAVISPRWFRTTAPGLPEISHPDRLAGDPALAPGGVVDEIGTDEPHLETFEKP